MVRRRMGGRRRGLLRGMRGWTLIELMVAVAIVAILAAIAITLYQEIQKKAKLAADQGTLAAIRSAIAIYYGRNDGVFPSAAPAGPPFLQAAVAWQCAGQGTTYNTSDGTVALAINDFASCN